MCEKRVARLVGMPVRDLCTAVDHMPQNEIRGPMKSMEAEEYLRRGESHLIGKKI